MALIIINKNVKGTGNKVYRDALTTDGTLSLFDFSNKGFLKNYDISKKIIDLSEGNSIGGDNIVFSKEDRGTFPYLTEDKGLPLINYGSYSANNKGKGFVINNVSSYLYEKQPNTLFVFWLKLKKEGANAVIIDGGINQRQVRLNNAGVANISMTIAGKVSFSNYNTDYNLVQLGVEFRKDKTNISYVNGLKFSESMTTEGLFEAPNETKTIDFGIKLPGLDSRGVLYRGLIEDLEVSGRKALEVVKKDYEYVSGTGQYTGIAPRPFFRI